MITKHHNKRVFIVLIQYLALLVDGIAVMIQYPAIQLSCDSYNDPVPCPRGELG